MILEKLRDLEENRGFDRSDIEEIADEMEESIGQAEMWNTLRPGFSTDELLENLIFIARELDL